MEQKDIDIYEILKDMPKGTKLYTPLVGMVEFTSVATNKEAGEATEGEACTFQEACTLWEKKEKEAMEQPAFKTFNKVLVRNRGDQKWMPAFFVRDRGEETGWRYNVLPIHSGKSADFISCIPYEGHEDFAFTDYDYVDLPF